MTLQGGPKISSPLDYNCDTKRGIPKNYKTKQCISGSGYHAHFKRFSDCCFECFPWSCSFESLSKFSEPGRRDPRSHIISFVKADGAAWQWLQQFCILTKIVRARKGCWDKRTCGDGSVARSWILRLPLWRCRRDCTSRQRTCKHARHHVSHSKIHHGLILESWSTSNRHHPPLEVAFRP